MEVCAVEEERPLHWSGIPVGLVQQFKQSRPDVHWNPHNDALRHTWNRNAGGVKAQLRPRVTFNFPTQVKRQFTADGVLLSKVGGIEEVVGCFLKGGQHQDTLLHFG